MSGFKTTLITCRQCGRRIMVRPADAERVRLPAHTLAAELSTYCKRLFQYDENIVNGLPDFGQLTYLGNPETTYPLRFGDNVIGTSDTCTVRVERFIHQGQCFISRRHCTLTITFDKWTGQLRYHIQDGAVEPDTQTVKSSLNGTLLNGTPLQKTERIDVGNGEIITLGGIDRFRLTHAVVNPVMLDTYKVDLAFNPDRTQ